MIAAQAAYTEALCDFVSGVFVVTESSTGPRKRFREMTVAHGGGHGQGLGFPRSLLSGTLSSHGAPAVPRPTSA